MNLSNLKEYLKTPLEQPGFTEHEIENTYKLENRILSGLKDIINKLSFDEWGKISHENKENLTNLYELANEQGFTKILGYDHVWSKVSYLSTCESTSKELCTQKHNYTATEIVKTIDKVMAGDFIESRGYDNGAILWGLMANSNVNNDPALHDLKNALKKAAFYDGQISEKTKLNLQKVYLNKTQDSNKTHKNVWHNVELLMEHAQSTLDIYKDIANPGKYIAKYIKRNDLTKLFKEQKKHGLTGSQEQITNLAMNTWKLKRYQVKRTKFETTKNKDKNRAAVALAKRRAKFNEREGLSR